MTFASSLLTDRGPADWHPARPEARAIFRQAADYCRKQGTNISKLAVQFSSQNPDTPTTMFSSANPESVKRNVKWHAEPLDAALLTEVWKILSAVRNEQWNY